MALQQFLTIIDVVGSTCLYISLHILKVFQVDNLE